MRSLQENIKSIARSTLVQQGVGLRFSCKGQRFEVNKLFIVSRFALSLKVHDWPVGVTKNMRELFPKINRSVHTLYWLQTQAIQ